jgi:glycosyltransferase involved in cell wall biosynthesis
VELIRTPWPTHQPLARILWEQSVLPLALRRVGAHLVHGLVNVLPLTSTLPGVVTVHDLSFVRLPQAFPPLKRRYLTWLCQASVARAKRILAVSQQTADDLVHYFHVQPDRIDVVYNGVAPEFQPGQQDGAAFRQAHGLPDRFLLYLGTLEPRKNLANLVRAFALWRQQAPPADQDVALVLAGGKGWYYQEIFQLVHELGVGDWVRFPGFVPGSDLPDWYRAATLFLYPSLLEGFGLPVVEAMACGTPVICSRAASLLEVAGEAALGVDATDPQALAQGIGQVLGDSPLAHAMRQAGLERASRFSWVRTAQETLTIYERILD